MRKPLLLTGRPGCGKTTVVRRVVEHLSEQRIPVQGFYTLEVREGGRRVGFDVITVPEGRVAPLARVQPGAAGPRVGRYRVFVATLEALVLPLLQARDPRVRLLVVDEIGAMELLSSRFREAVARLLAEPPCCLLATIQEKQVRRFLEPMGLLDRVDLWTLRFGEAGEMSRRVLEELAPCWSGHRAAE